MSNHLIEVKNVYKIYNPGENEVRALDGISVTIDHGEFVAIVGHSGSGKSTFMNMLGCLDTPTSGDYYLDGVNVAGMTDDELSDIRNKQIGFIFQGFNLIPSLTAQENVELPLVYRGMPAEQRHQLAEEALTRVGMEHRMSHRPSELSGGQQQRVAIARSLVNQPRVLLLDEPLGALDLKLRKEMQLELKRLQREMNITFVYVTHDQEEALTMSDTVVVMSGGKIQQIGSPQDIYNEPKNAFVARFIGDSNIVDGVMLKDFLVNFGGYDFTCVDRGFKPNEPVQVVIRPEDVQIVPPSVGMLTGLVREVIFKGVHFEMHVDVEGYEWIIHSTQASQPGELIGMNIGPDEIHIMKRSEV